jgi:hypothetical protein
MNVHSYYRNAVHLSSPNWAFRKIFILLNFIINPEKYLRVTEMAGYNRQMSNDSIIAVNGA